MTPFDSVPLVFLICLVPCTPLVFVWSVWFRAVSLICHFYSVVYYILVGETFLVQCLVVNLSRPFSTFSRMFPPPCMNWKMFIFCTQPPQTRRLFAPSTVMTKSTFFQKILYYFTCVVVQGVTIMSQVHDWSKYYDTMFFTASDSSPERARAINDSSSYVIKLQEPTQEAVRALHHK